MTQRKDGLARREQLLKVASEAPAGKDYRDATVAQTCAQAKASAAVMSYHFGSKEGLHLEVWREAFRPAMLHCPFDGGLDGHTPSEERLCDSIRAGLSRMVSVVHQCIAFGLKKGHVLPIFRGKDKRELLEQFTKHITSFSLSGIYGLRERLKR